MMPLGGLIAELPGNSGAERERTDGVVAESVVGAAPLEVSIVGPRRRVLDVLPEPESRGTPPAALEAWTLSVDVSAREPEQLLDPPVRACTSR